MGACRPDMLGNSTGGAYSGCGSGGTCAGYSWSFYPPGLPFAERACKFELYRLGSDPVTAVLPNPDCAALKCWLTSEILLGGLDGTECGDGRGNESTELQLLDGESHQKKFSACLDEPFRSHRAIIDSVVEKYFSSP